MGRKNKTKRLLYEENKYKYYFRQYEPIRSFGEIIYTSKINMDEAEMDQSKLLKNLVEFNNKSRLRTIKGKGNKEILMKLYTFFMFVN